MFQIKWKEKTVGFGSRVHSMKEEFGREGLHIKKMIIQGFLFKIQGMYNVESLTGE
tara:strand:- start:711 stop:878 length:168 start_codon:yes stop_codon:yes gene_type:complete